MFSAQEYRDRIDEAPHGEARLQELRNAITEADRAGETRLRMDFRLDYIKESCVYGDDYKAIIAFPELLKIFDEHPELEGQYSGVVMQRFKWVLESTFEFYQVSREQIERYLDEFGERCKRYGHSMQVLYAKKCYYALIMNREQLPVYYRAYTQYARGINSDCEACEATLTMDVNLAMGKEAEALRVARRIFQRGMRCTNVPRDTYADLVEYYLYQGNAAEAQSYGLKCEQYIVTNAQPALRAMGILMELFSLTGAQRGWGMLRLSLDTFFECRNPFLRMCYARGASRLLSVVEADEKDYTDAEVLKKIAKSTGTRKMTIEKAQAWFYNEALDLSKKFDARNGNDFCEKRLQADLGVATAAFVPGEETYRARGIVEQRYAMFAVTLPKGENPTAEELGACVAFPKGTKVLGITVQKGNLFIDASRGERTIEYVIAPMKIPEGMPIHPVAGMTEEACDAMQAVPEKYMIRTTYGKAPMKDLRCVMQMIEVLFPRMLGVVDLNTTNGYPPVWVHYAARYENAIMPDDLIGMQIVGEDSGDVNMTTMGLCALGLRELEIRRATEENFGMYVNFLDGAASQVVTRGVLPDEGEAFGRVIIDGEAYPLVWKEVPKDYEIGVMPAGFLRIKTGKGAVSPVDAGFLEQEGDFEFPLGRKEFLRRIYLAKETFEAFRELMRRPHKRAAVRVEYELSEEMVKQYGYSVEILWGEALLRDGKIIQRVREVSSAVPYVRNGDETEVTQERVAGWFLQLEETDTYVDPQDFFMLWEEEP